MRTLLSLSLVLAISLADLPRSLKRAAGAEPTTPQKAGEGPILDVGVALQFPSRVVPRSANLAARRRAVMLTDGAVYQARGAFGRKEPAIPYAYIVDAEKGALSFRMEFPARASPALPYGIAEDPKVGGACT